MHHFIRHLKRSFLKNRVLWHFRMVNSIENGPAVCSLGLVIVLDLTVRWDVVDTVCSDCTWASGQMLASVPPTAHDMLGFLNAVGFGSIVMREIHFLGRFRAIWPTLRTKQDAAHLLTWGDCQPGMCMQQYLPG